MSKSERLVGRRKFLRGAAAGAAGWRPRLLVRHNNRSRARPVKPAARWKSPATRNRDRTSWSTCSRRSTSSIARRTPDRVSEVSRNRSSTMGEQESRVDRRARRSGGTASRADQARGSGVHLLCAQSSSRQHAAVPRQSDDGPGARRRVRILAIRTAARPSRKHSDTQSVGRQDRLKTGRAGGWTLPASRSTCVGKRTRTRIARRASRTRTAESRSAPASWPPNRSSCRSGPATR